MIFDEAITLLGAERTRQDEKFGRLGSKDHTWVGSDTGKYVILGEEFGEVGRAILNWQSSLNGYEAGKARDNLKEELVQLAATAVLWLQCGW